MPLKPQVLKSNEYTIKKLIDKIGGDKEAWPAYFKLEEFQNVIKIIEKRVNLFKFELLVSEEELKKMYTEQVRINKRKSVLDAMIARGRLPKRKPKNVN